MTESKSYTLKLWAHPSTGEKRIYVNGGMLENSTKLYILAKGEGWDAKIYDAPDPSLSSLRILTGGTNYDVGLFYAEKALAERGLDRKSFAEITEAL